MILSGLDEGRAVQLLVVRGGAVVKVGSGYLVAGDLVLTAAHVVTDADSVIVRRVLGRQQVQDVAGATEWIDADADVAVVRREEGADLSTLPPVRYGQIVGDRLVHCQTLGFPRSKLRQDTRMPGAAEVVRYRDTHHAFGDIPPYSNLREGTLAINVPKPEYDSDPARSPWEGMSGAAVFAEGALIGVVSKHHRSDGLGWLAAQRVRDWYDLPSERLEQLRALIGLPELDQLARVGTVSAESHYLEKVVRRDIAPDLLYDRDAELAELARFCTDDDPAAPSYTWWRGPAWSGKSALMAWFALHPPPGVRTVAFFLRAQVPHQNTWIDFADNLLQQLAALLDRQPPTGLTDATRQEVLLALMDDAAEACRRRGDRLVLVLDGLDEDQGGHSVAWLLPAKPAAGMRVIVSGRDHPPLPEGVLDDDHPLCDAAVVRVLAGSEHATMMRRRAADEIRRLAEGSDLEQLLLGLVTAARGALSRADLAALAACDEAKVRQRLAAVTGRTFAEQPSRYRPDMGPKLYVLAHRDLPAMAEERLGEAPLRRARRRLHAWFDEYRDRRWPVDTPEYLLTGYFDMVSEAGEVDRMVACATDQARQHRMLDVTGGGAAALAEVAATQNAILGQDDPDLLSMTRLALHRKALLERHQGLSERLPLVWARLGNPVRAESLARSIVLPGRRDVALSSLANLAAETGDFGRAKALTAAIAESVWRAESLTFASWCAARRGGGAWATMFAGEAAAAVTAVADEAHRAQVLATLAAVVTQAGDVVRAAGIVDAVRNTGSGVVAALVAAIAETGDVGRAEVLAEAITDPAARDAAAAALASASAAQSGGSKVPEPVLQGKSQLETALEQAEAGDIDRAQALAEAIADPFGRAGALRRVASVAGDRGGRERALAVLRRAEAAATEVADPYKRAAMTGGMALTAARNGDIEYRDALISAIGDEGLKTSTLRDLALSAARAGDVNEAVALARRVKTRAWLLVDATEAAASAGKLDAAEALARAVNDPSYGTFVTTVDRQDQVRAMAIAADAAALAGDRPRAIRLADDAEALAYSSGAGQPRQWALEAMAVALAVAGDADTGAIVASYLADPDTRSQTLADICEAAARAGEAESVEAIARSIPEPLVQAVALAAARCAWARAGDQAHAAQLAQEVESLVLSEADAGKRVFILGRMAVHAADQGDDAQARIWARQATALAETLPDTPSNQRTVASAAAAGVIVGDTRPAEATAAQMDDRYDRQYLLSALARSIAKAGDLDRAEDFAAGIDDPETHAEVLAAVAVTVSEAGEHSAAIELARRSEAVARSIEGERIRNQALDAPLMASVIALARAGEIDRAAAIAAENEQPRSWGLWIALAGVVAPLPARRAMARALVLGGAWSRVLPALARVDPAVVREVVDEFVAVFGPTA